MTTLTTKIESTLKGLSTDNLIAKLIETMSNMKLAVLNVAIQEELELRIGEDKVDEIMDANR